MCDMHVCPMYFFLTMYVCFMHVHYKSLLNEIPCIFFSSHASTVFHTILFKLFQSCAACASSSLPFIFFWG
jgi:hypothetical protein